MKCLHDAADVQLNEKRDTVRIFQHAVRVCQCACVCALRGCHWRARVRAPGFQMSCWYQRDHCHSDQPSSVTAQHSSCKRVWRRHPIQNTQVTSHRHTRDTTTYHNNVHVRVHSACALDRNRRSTLNEYVLFVVVNKRQQVVHFLKLLKFHLLLHVVLNLNFSCRLT